MIPKTIFRSVQGKFFDTRDQAVGDSVFRASLALLKVIEPINGDYVESDRLMDKKETIKRLCEDLFKSYEGKGVIEYSSNSL